MNGLPVEFHVGKTIREILGPAAQQLEPRLERVFATGKSTRFEFEARLPKRNETGRWNVMYFPFKSNEFEGVCAEVRELTENSSLRVSLFGLTSKLQALRAIINRETVETRDCTRRALDLLNMCISEVIALSKTSHPAIQKITQDIPSAHESPNSSVRSTDFASHDSLQACLTNRELEVVGLISDGKANKEIAVALKRRAAVKRAKFTLANLALMKKALRYPLAVFININSRKHSA